MNILPFFWTETNLGKLLQKVAGQGAQYQVPPTLIKL